MTRFVLTRLGESVLAVFGVVTIVFLVTRVLGDPAAVLMPPGTSAAQLDIVRRQLGLDQPIWVQYLSFLRNAAVGDFGLSYVHQRPAMTLVLERMPATLTLAVLGTLSGLVLGLAGGLLAALHRGRLTELVIMICALIGQATPTFWIGLMAIMIFAVELGWLPTGGTGTAQHLVLPVATIGVFVAANVIRLFRSSLLDVMHEDYMRTAQAKGLAPRTVLTWHLVRNALIPVTTMSGLLFADLLGGSVITETIFSWPGVGMVIMQAIGMRDFPVIQAGVAVAAVAYVSINFLVDLLYGVLDPKVRARSLRR